MTAPGNIRDCCVFLEPKDSEFQGSRALCFPGADAETKVMLAGLASGILAVTPGDNQPGCCDTGSWVSPGDAQAQCSPSLLGHLITEEGWTGTGSSLTQLQGRHPFLGELLLVACSEDGQSLSASHTLSPSKFRGLHPLCPRTWVLSQ